MEPGAGKLHRRRGSRDHRFDAHLVGELQRAAIRQRIRVFGRFILSVRRPVGQLDAPQPLHAHVAFPARQQQAHRIAMLRAQALAVLVERDQRVVERLLQRDAAAHVRGVGAFREQPFRLRLEAGFVEQHAQGDAGPFAAGDVAVHSARRHLCGLGTQGAQAVARALDEIGAREHRVARERFDREPERALHQPVDIQAMKLRIDVGRAAVAADEVNRSRRDDAVERLDRGKRCARTGRHLSIRLGDMAADRLLEP